MKKNNLFKVLGIVILAYVILSWILPLGIDLFGGKDVPTSEVGIISIFSVLTETVSAFGSILVYVLAVGGFYAILDATGVYKKALNIIVKKFKGKEKLFLILTIVLIAIISSISGLEIGLFVIFPFIISIILLMGYDKLIALSATVGATIIGIYGSTFASTTYGINNQVTSLSLLDGILPKVILFVLGLGLLVFYVLSYIKKNKINAELPKDVDKIVKGTKKKVWPLFLIVGLLFLFYVLGTTSWEGIFGKNWFSTAHDSIMSLTIGEFDIFNKLFGGLAALGTWSDPTRLQYYTILLLIASVLLSIIYKVKVNDAIESYLSGVKEYIIPGLLVVGCCSLFVFTYYYPILTTVTNWILSLADDFNIALSGIYTMISSVFYADYYYFAYYALYPLVESISDSSLYSVVSILVTNLYGLMLLIAPTSMLLLASLSITEVSYKEWFKFIWKLFLSLLIISFIVFVILLLI